VIAATVASLLAATSVPAEPPRPASFAEHQTACAGKDGWSDPAPPVRIFGNVYDVGTCGIVVLLIAGEEGAIVIDGATAEAAPAVLANIQRLGLQASDVKLLLSTHEHVDHASGLRALKQASGAAMLARGDERRALESGVASPDDPQRGGDLPGFQGVKVDRVLRDGEVVRLGSLRLTAHATPGHAPGGTSWTWRSCEAVVCRNIAYADSLSAIAANGYRFADHPAYVRTFQASIAKVAVLPCDILVTPHPAASDLYARLAGQVPLVDSEACVTYAATAAAKLDARLAEDANR
jgi:metallo-beta-lactamase class B